MTGRSKVISVSGLAPPGTGVGVVQRNAYPLLQEAGIELRFRRDGIEPTGLVRRASRLSAALFAPYSLQFPLLSMVTPLPVVLPSRVVVVVHDLRWLRIRGALARHYRAADLRRTVRQASHLVCISSRTQSDLVGAYPDAAAKSRVSWLGPGIVPPGSFHSGDSGIVLLVGGAPHKRNELAAAALAMSRPSWVGRIEGVGLSPHAKDLLEAGFGAASCTWHSRVPDEELVAAYQRAQYFVGLGVEEGFGLPFVEALAAGCEVVAINQPLTRELLGDAGRLLVDGSVDVIAEQLTGLAAVSETIRRDRAMEFSWSGFVGSLTDALGV